MIQPFHQESVDALRTISESIERNKYGLEHFQNYRINAYNQLQDYLNTGRVPDRDCYGHIGSRNVDLPYALYDASRYAAPYPERLLPKIEAALTQTELCVGENDIGYQYHRPINTWKGDGFIPIRFSSLKTVFDVDRTESGFDIWSDRDRTVCLQPGWTANRCETEIIKAIEIKTESINYKRLGPKNRCIELVVYSIANPSINVISGLSQSFPPYLEVVDVQHSYPNSEWSVPNTRYTVFNTKQNVELYISIYPVSMRNIEQILTSRCYQILKDGDPDNVDLNHYPEMLQAKYWELRDSINEVLSNLESASTDMRVVSNSISDYNTQIDFKKALNKIIPEWSFGANEEYVIQATLMYALIRAYNFYIRSQQNKPFLDSESQSHNALSDSFAQSIHEIVQQYQMAPYSILGCNSMESLLLEAITGFKKTKDNWLTDDPDNSECKTCKKEPELSQKLAAFIERNHVCCSVENDTNAGRYDIHVAGGFINSFERATIECKRVTKDSDSEIIDKYCKALEQIRHYTEDSQHSGYILFFVFDRELKDIEDLLLNCDELLTKTDDYVHSYGFNLVHDNKYKLKLLALPAHPPTTTYKQSPITKAIKQNYKKLNTVNPLGDGDEDDYMDGGFEWGG